MHNTFRTLGFASILLGSLALAGSSQAQTIGSQQPGGNPPVQSTLPAGHENDHEWFRQEMERLKVEEQNLHAEQEKLQQDLHHVEDREREVYERMKQLHEQMEAHHHQWEQQQNNH